MPVHHDPKRRLHGFGRTFALLPVRNPISLQSRKVDTVFVVLAAWVDQESHELRILQGLLAVPLLGDLSAWVVARLRNRLLRIAAARGWSREVRRRKQRYALLPSVRPQAVQRATKTLLFSVPDRPRRSLFSRGRSVA